MCVCMCVCMYVDMYVDMYVKRNACIQPEDAFMRAYTHLYAGTHRHTRAGTDARRRQKAGTRLRLFNLMS